MGAKTTRTRYGPIYLDELGSWEVRSLSTGARELWMALAPRTRSAKGGASIGCEPPQSGPRKGGGWYVSYDDLARDLARPKAKTKAERVKAKAKGERLLVPMHHKAIQRRMAELREAGLVRTWWDRPGHQMVALLRPPSLCELCADKAPCAHDSPPMDNSIDYGRHRSFSAPKLSPTVDSFGGEGGQPRGVHPFHGSDQSILNLSIEEGIPPIEQLRDILQKGLSAKDRESPVPAEVEGHYPRELGCSTWCDLAAKLPMVLRGWAIREAKAHSIEVPERDGLDALIRQAAEKASTMVSSQVEALRQLFRLKGIDVPAGLNPAEIHARYGMELSVGSGR